MAYNPSSISELQKSLPATVLTIFGATGDLSLTHLLPTLIHMEEHNLLPKTFKLVCVGRRDLNTQTFFKFFTEKTATKFPPELIKKFASRVIYFQADLDQPESFSKLPQVLADKQISKQKHECYNRLYYFATAPNYFAPIAKILKTQGLLIGCTSHERTIRILVEKPFGNNLSSAKNLNKELLKFFREKQIYRIDHYLGKETVQNLLVMRFANDLFEPIWNSKFIDHIEISVLESLGVGNRINFYNQTGALKDSMQNHVLQMLALIAMEEPKNLDPESIRDQKLKILKALTPFNSKNIRGSVVRGQYAEYKQEAGQVTNTETYVAIKTQIKTPRWKGVPIYLRSGKRLGKKVTEISVHFKKQCVLFGSVRKNNVLTFRIQPDESVQLQINNKIPGFGIDLHSGTLDFGYKTAFLTEIPGAYERLLLDFIQGDQRLFIRSDEIEAAWKFVDSITKNWNSKNAPLQKYSSGSLGPKVSDQMLLKDNRFWQAK